VNGKTVKVFESLATTMKLSNLIIRLDGLSVNEVAVI